MIDSSEFGFIVVDRKKYNHDVIVTYKGKVKRCELEKRHLFSEKEFLMLLNENPEVIVIGTGQYGECKVSEKILKMVEERGIKIIIKETKEAIIEFNELMEAGKKPVAYIHVTC
ncbi:MAG: MTH938/NDUFAF3 family protein [Candidatus Aenigmatarchaeota archaeon]